MPRLKWSIDAVKAGPRFLDKKIKLPIIMITVFDDNRMLGLPWRKEHRDLLQENISDNFAGSHMPGNAGANHDVPGHCKDDHRRQRECRGRIPGCQRLINAFQPGKRILTPNSRGNGLQTFMPYDRRPASKTVRTTSKRSMRNCRSKPRNEVVPKQ